LHFHPPDRHPTNDTHPSGGTNLRHAFSNSRAHLEAPLVQPRPVAVRHIDRLHHYRIGAHVIGRSPRRALPALPVHRPRRLARAFEVAHRHGVQLRIEPFHLRDEVVQQLQAADRAATDQRGQRRGRKKPQLPYDQALITTGRVSTSHTLS